MWKVHLDKSVDRKLKKIPNPDRRRIQRAIDVLEYAPEILDIKPLVSRPGYRLRVGNWRLLMDIYDETNEIFVYMLAPCGDVYKK